MRHGVDPPAGGAGGVLAVAHRGEPVGFRENTVAAVRAAIEAGADLVEIDVKTTADGVSVVLHDDSLTRLWGVEREVRQMTAAEVADVGDGSVAGRIPALEEVLGLFGGTACAVMVDMDSGEWATAARYAVQRAVDAGHLRSSQVVWCGDVAGLREVRDADPAARVFLSWGEQARQGFPSDELVAALAPEAFNPHWELLDAGGRGWAREHGLPLSCWTVDDPTLMARLVDGGVEAVISNRIHDLLKVLGRG